MESRYYDIDTLGMLASITNGSTESTTEQAEAEVAAISKWKNGSSVRSYLRKRLPYAIVISAKRLAASDDAFEEFMIPLGKPMLMVEDAASLSVFNKFSDIDQPVDMIGDFREDSSLDLRGAGALHVYRNARWASFIKTVSGKDFILYFDDEATAIMFKLRFG